MDLVNRGSSDIDGGLIAEREVRSVDIVVNGLGQMNDVEAFLAEQICRLLGAVSAEDNQAVKAKLVVVLLHRLHLVKALRIRHAHQLERLAGRSDDRTALRQDTRKVG